MNALSAISIAPQKGPQEAFLSSSADIVIYGGGAGGGKTYALLLEAMRHTSVKGFGAVIFRRESVQITNEGGLWDSALSLYPLAGGRPVKAPKLGFVFPKGAKVTFAHLNQESDVLGWQGSQVTMIAFDELTHFTRSQFFYLLSRNRSTCGVRPYVRATCNPDADSWVAELISWWIGTDGIPTPERAGVVRWFARVDDTIHWGESASELSASIGVSESDCKSLTFIPALVTDNPALLRADPGYLANLKALSRVERERLLSGNWKIRPSAGLYFPRHAVQILDAAPRDIISRVRAWDLASTPPTESNPSPDATAGVLIGRRESGRFIVLHVTTLRDGAHKVREAVSNTASQDGMSVRIVLPQDPGQAGKSQAADMTLMLSPHLVSIKIPSGSKITRAEPFAAQWQAGNVDIVQGPWNDAYLSEMEAFPTPGAHDDQVDASSDAFAALDAYGPADWVPVVRGSGRARDDDDDFASDWALRGL